MSYDIENTPNIRKTFEIEFKKERKNFISKFSTGDHPKKYPIYQGGTKFFFPKMFIYILKYDAKAQRCYIVVITLPTLNMVDGCRYN